MAEVKIANWNIEWMNRWFTGDSQGAPELRPQETWASVGVTDLPALLRRVAAVIRSIDPDILTVQEGPSRKSEMAIFVRDFLDDAYAIQGPVGSGQQKLFTLVKKANAPVTEVRPILAEHDFEFGADWDVDLDADLELDSYGFTRPPQVLQVTVESGRSFRLVNLHLKSKYVHGGARMWNDPGRRQDFIRTALTARRRISAEAMRVREYLDLCFAADEAAGKDTAILVAGDFNDGPGFDLFERLYLTHGLAATLAGSPYRPRRMLRHGFVDEVGEDENWTAIFDDFVEEVQGKKTLLDHILLSASLYWDPASGGRISRGRIEHEAFDAQLDATATTERQKHPSDHRPQSVTLWL